MYFLIDYLIFSSKTASFVGPSYRPMETIAFFFEFFPSFFTFFVKIPQNKTRTLSFLTRQMSIRKTDIEIEHAARAESDYNTVDVGVVLTLPQPSAVSHSLLYIFDSISSMKYII